MNKIIVKKIQYIFSEIPNIYHEDETLRYRETIYYAVKLKIGLINFGDVKANNKFYRTPSHIEHSYYSLLQSLSGDFTVK